MSLTNTVKFSNFQLIKIFFHFKKKKDEKERVWKDKHLVNCKGKIPSPRKHFSATQFGNFIFIFGGGLISTSPMETSFSNELYVFDSGYSQTKMICSNFFFKLRKLYLFFKKFDWKFYSNRQIWAFCCQLWKIFIYLWGIN